MQYVYLVIAVVGEVIATTALKSSAGFTNLVPSLVVVAGYAIAFYFLSLTLHAMSVGIAYAIWSGLGIVLVSIIAWVRFGQVLDTAAPIGMALILAGVVVINVFSNTAAH